MTCSGSTPVSIPISASMLTTSSVGKLPTEPSFVGIAMPPPMPQIAPSSHSTPASIPPALAEGLQVPAGATALEVQRTYKLAGGKIAQIAINTHPASRFRHSMTMRRVKG